MTLIDQLVTLTRVGVLHDASRQSLVTLQTRNCGNLWRISIRRSNFSSCMHPQQSSINSLGWTSQGAVILMGMTQEVTFPKVGGWVPPRQSSPDSSSSMTRWRMGSSGTTSSAPKACSSKSGLGCLINTLASGLCLGTPRINTFSGEAMPGKTEVSFEQWYHEVQCVKDHYRESRGLGKHSFNLFKGAVVDIARYMGPTTSVTEVLQKLMVIFGTVTSFDVLMQNFYKVTQGNHEKVPSFATRLEEYFKSDSAQVPQKDSRLWGGMSPQRPDYSTVVHKHIRDSIRYLHSNPKTTYCQLMVAARKDESEMEDAKEKVKSHGHPLPLKWQMAQKSCMTKLLG